MHVYFVCVHEQLYSQTEYQERGLTWMIHGQTLSGTIWPPALIIAGILFSSHGHFTSLPIKTEAY